MTQEQLENLFDEAKYEEVIAEADEDNVSKAFLPKLALSYFHTEDYEKSTGIFEKICEESNDPVGWFNLCTSSIMKGDDRRGLEALRCAIKYNRETETNGKGMPTPFMLLYAVRALVDTEKYNQAFNQLNELAEVYGALSITDSHFLYTRGVPFFDEFVKLCKAVLAKQKVTDSQQWITYLSSRLDEEGKIQMNNI